MPSRYGLVGTATSLLLAAAVVTAAPAEARNIGGFDSVCVAPGGAVIGPHGPGLGANCICVVVATNPSLVLAGPNGTCPPGNDPARKK
jgi:hypothetical protein